ncbi:siderophore ferric iron reductase [Marinomonas transparens]|uniref:Siderophore ferric iron reductase n=1 Tax=Marinomonas transparens TaxID=2795388 RepID=A0A934MYE3_9GAMM|nr:siderophore ferric iron reductase [Marinomonas transparens]MBJ7536365.1 siderophore ferric iron reductase [Marinomonas transparens]
MEEPLHHLFSESEQYLALLQGSELDTDLEESSQLLSAACAEPFLASLHLELNKAHPEAGAPYWRVRSWGLSCWQPIYLALICVYHLKLVPENLGKLHQKQQQDYVAGYALPDGKWLSGNHEALVQQTAERLKILFDALQTAHLKQFGGREALYQGLLADQIMMVMVAAATPPATLADIQKEYRLWAKHLDLTTDPLNRLNQGAEEITFLRRSCCLHFRRNDGELCNNCPRALKSKKGTSCLN